MQGIGTYTTIFENLYDGIYFVDKERRITFWNKGAERITGFKASEVIGRHCFENILAHTDEKGTQLCFSGCPLHESLWDNQIHSASVFLHHKDGHRIPVSVRTIPISQENEIIGAVEVFQERYEDIAFSYNVDELKNLALKDQLTGMPNRRYIETFLQSKANEYAALGIQFGVLFMDIDHFKNVNDTYGHETGDEVLKMVARTLTVNMRSTDLIGRWGGEEFVGIFVCFEPEALFQVAEKARLLVENSFLTVNGESIHVTISIGAALYHSSDTMETIIKRADELLYLSKSNGRNRVTIE